MSVILGKSSIFWRSKDKIYWTYGLCLESLVQWAAVSIWEAVIKDPPHQNSLLRGPCRNMAAIHGQLPGAASSPPTTLKLADSGCPHSENE